MEKNLSQFNSDFLKFLNDPGIGVKHPHKETLTLEDFFIFPDLLQSRAPIPGSGTAQRSIISSSELIHYENFSGVIFISGQRDSGKTALLKILMKRYIGQALYPLYIDCKAWPSVLTEDFAELIRDKYEEQYSEGSLHDALNSPGERKVLLLDNIDNVTIDRELITGIITKFGFVIACSSSALKAEASSGKLGSDISSTNLEIMELSVTLRRALSEKWHHMTADPKRKEHTPGSEQRIQRSLKIIDEIIGRDLIASYPLTLLTILNSETSGDTLSPSESSYGHYFEHLITKPISELVEGGEFKVLINFLSVIANKMFTERKHSLTETELKTLHDMQPKELQFTGETKDILNTLTASGTLTEKDSGFYFKYGYTYHYFTASYLAQNIGLESVRDDISRLCANLGDTEYSNIVLFLTHLSEDPFILKAITGVLDITEIGISTDSVDEGMHEVDELIESILSAGDKQKKLKELRAEYAPSIKRPSLHTPQLTQVNEYRRDSYIQGKGEEIKNIHKELALLHIAGELLKKLGRERVADAEIKTLAKKLYLFWLRSLGATSKSLLKKSSEFPQDNLPYSDRSISSAEYLRRLERYSLCLNTYFRYTLALSRSLGSIPLSELFSSKDERVPPESFKLIEFVAIPWGPDTDAAESEIRRIIAGRPGKLTQALIREIGASYILLHYEGKERSTRLLRLINALEPGSKY